MDTEKLRELEQEMRQGIDWAGGMNIERTHAQWADRLRDILAAQPPKAEVSDADVEAGCLAAVEVSGFNPKNWPHTYPDANQLRKVVRAVLNTATPTAAAEREDAYRHGWINSALWANRDDLIADIGSPAYNKARDVSLAAADAAAWAKGAARNQEAD